MKPIFTAAMLFCLTCIYAQKVIIKTEQGDIIVKLYPKKAPLTVANFLRYVDDKAYDNTTFYRTVRLDNQKQSSIPIQVIQGGLVDDLPAKPYPAIPLERTNQTGLSHKVGAISMARYEPDTATTEFFIIVNEDQPQLDYDGNRNPDKQGYAVFGKVVKGMKVVEAINKSETVMWEEMKQKQWIKNPVKILTIKRK